MIKKVMNLSTIMILMLSVSCAGLGISSTARSEFQKGLSLFNQSRYAEAIPYFRSATEEEPEYYEAYLYLGRSFINTGQYASSLGPLRTAYRLSPEKARGEVLDILIDSLFNIATSSLKSGDTSRFQSGLNEILELKGGSDAVKSNIADDLIRFASSEMQNGNYGVAISAFREVLNLAPNSFEAYLGLANAYFSEGNILKAISNAKKALQINPESSEALSIYNNFSQ